MESEATGTQSRLLDAGDESKRLMRVIQPSVFLLLAAGYANLQARQMLITHTVQHMGEEVVLSATRGLATSFSIGSIIEFFLSPYFGRFSDRFGRKPMLISFLVGPTIMRTLCVLVKQPQARVYLLWLDFVSVRTIGVQPTQAVVGTMISDVVPVCDQPRARAQVTASIALGQIVGNYAAGWWNAKHGPESTFKVIAGIPAVVFAFIAYSLSETHPELRKHKAIRDAKSEKLQDRPCASSVPTPKAKGGAIKTLLCDSESCLLALILGLYEFMQYPGLATVSNLFMKDRMHFGPLQQGRFSSAFGLAIFMGSTFAGRLIDTLGSARHVSFAHFCTGIAYLLWGTAASGMGMVASLFPLALGTGANTVLMTRFVVRASELGVGKGEAGALIQAIGAIVRAVAPQLFMQLYLRALTSSKRANSGRRLPLGSPMLLVAVVAMVQESLYQMMVRAKQSRQV